MKKIKDISENINKQQILNKLITNINDYIS